jgi:adenosylcobinamide kinase / adenosylcobinamide-phosphate guanylyltransferase
MFTFVTGGLRSGKSGYALRRASELGPPPWLYVAPNADGDDDLKARLAGHRRDQEARWKLIEAPELLWNALDPQVIDHHGAVVVDRFTIWLTSHLSRIPKSSDRDFLREIEQLADRLYRSATPVVLVTTEIGLGFLPASVPDRRLINVAGLANQILAERAQSVVMMVSGLPLRLR